MWSGPDRHTNHLDVGCSPEVARRPTRHRRESWRSSPARLDCSDGRASDGSTWLLGAALPLGLRDPGGVPNPGGTGGIQRRCAAPHHIVNGRFTGPLLVGIAPPRLPENRGVPGSSPGLAIAESSCKSAIFSPVRRAPSERLRATEGAQSPNRSPNGPRRAPAAARRGRPARAPAAEDRRAARGGRDRRARLLPLPGRALAQDPLHQPACRGGSRPGERCKSSERAVGPPAGGCRLR